jgi:hypothetical protein
MTHGKIVEDGALAFGQLVWIAQPEITRASQQCMDLAFSAPYLIDLL